jgi:UDP-N-acetylmuramyl pentapeptide synthase
MVKTIGALIDRLPAAELTGDPETLIHDVRFDSREVRSGTLFAALRGG